MLALEDAPYDPDLSAISRDDADVARLNSLLYEPCDCSGDNRRLVIVGSRCAHETITRRNVMEVPWECRRRPRDLFASPLSRSDPVLQQAVVEGVRCVFRQRRVHAVLCGQQVVWCHSPCKPLKLRDAHTRTKRWEVFDDWSELFMVTYEDQTLSARDQWDDRIGLVALGRLVDDHGLEHLS